MTLLVVLASALRRWPLDPRLALDRHRPERRRLEERIGRRPEKRARWCSHPPARVLHCAVATGATRGSIRARSTGPRWSTAWSSTTASGRVEQRVFKRHTFNERARRRSRTSGRRFVHSRRSPAASSGERWAMDVTEITLGVDDWAHLAALTGLGDRIAVPGEPSLSGHAREVDRALVGPCLDRRGSRLRPARPETQVAGAHVLRVHLPACFPPVLHSPGQASLIVPRGEFVRT
jgi:hypothetical protein